MAKIGHCEKDDCTAATTGICLLGNSELKECQFYQPEGSLYTESESDDQAFDEGRTFHAGSELGVLDALQITRGSYCHFIGIMGPYNAGKTCFLLSLYLMTIHSILPDGFKFCRSLTLQGFEDRARRLRNWKGGQLPTQLAEHTIIGDERRPGFLHLGIKSDEDPIDFLLSDLPGEWTTELVKNVSTAERWKFLHRADGVIIVLDGIELLSEDGINNLIDTQQLLLRLRDTVQIPLDLPLVLLVSKADELQMQEPPLLAEIVAFAKREGFAPQVVMCASFSRDPESVRNGTGVFDALRLITHPNMPLLSCPVERDHSLEPLRPFHAYRYEVGGTFFG